MRFFLLSLFFQVTLSGKISIQFYSLEIFEIMTFHLLSWSKNNSFIFCKWKNKSFHFSLISAFNCETVPSCYFCFYAAFYITAQWKSLSSMKYAMFLILKKKSDKLLHWKTCIEKVQLVAIGLLHCHYMIERGLNNTSQLSVQDKCYGCSYILHLWYVIGPWKTTFWKTSVYSIQSVFQGFLPLMLYSFG